ncbi:hypothetical protein Tco_0699390 [Tanacetum coccineum]
MVIWSMTSEQHGSGLRLHQLTPGYISSGLVQNPVSPTPYVPPSKKDYEILFQPLFDEYFNPPPRAVSPDPVAFAAPRAVDPAGSPSSTTIDQDVPSASTSPTNHEIQSQVIHLGVEEQIHGKQNAQFDNAPLLHNLLLDPSFEETTLQGVISSNLHHLNQSFDTLTKLTRTTHWRMLLMILLNQFRQEVNYKNMPFGATLTQMTIRFHSVGNGLVETYYLKGRIMVNIRVIPHSIHSDDGNPTSANIKQALRQPHKDALVTRTPSAVAKPYQGDSFEFYLITGFLTVAVASP